MAKTKSKQKKGQMKFQLGINDERVPKLLGILCLFFALILFIAFVSYVFTWKEDQDVVHRFSIGLLLQGDTSVANWLGRFGAIISNMFFYWGFGLASFLFVGLLSKVGVSMIKREPLNKQMPVFRYTIFFVMFLAILFEFIFQGAAFPWGGAFGEIVSMWLQKFLGTVGTALLFLLVLLGTIVWFTNPDFNELTIERAFANTKQWFTDIINGRKPTVPTRAAKDIEPPKVLKPEVRRPVFEPAAPAAAAQVPKPPMPKVEGSQMTIGLDQPKAAKAEPLKAGEGQLEIESNPFKPNIASLEDTTPPPVHPVVEPAKGNVDHSEPYDPTLDLSLYEHPVVSLLHDYSDQKVEIDRAELEANKNQIIETLLNYKIEITKIKATIGPTVTLYEIVPAAGVRISKIKNLEDDIALSLAALGIRIIAPIPGRGTIGIEVPNRKKQIVSLKETLLSEKFKNAKMDLPIAMGKTISNEVFVADLAKMPHLLIAGATGQGKSVGINTILMSLLYKKHPSQLKLVLVDPKKVELFPYSKIEKHFLGVLPGQDEPITTETNKVIHTLNSLCIEMDQRYDLLKKGQARNIREYNEKFTARRLNPLNGHKFLPFIVLVIDEFADLIMTAGKEVELPIGRLAQLARAVGIHLIIATQRPSVNIITGVIKANFPARIAFKVSSKVDSRTILDGGGADQLIGRGDMLLTVGGDMVRLQCAFVDTPEVERVINYIGDQTGYPTAYELPEFHGDDEVHGNSGIKYSELDDLFEDGARLVVSNQHGSTSMIQRRLKLGYNRAGRIMDQMEAMGIVGPSEGSKAREVLIYDEIELERYLEGLKNRK